MTTEEKTKMEVSACMICTLADKMKDCKACQFNHALPLKNNTVSTTSQGKEE